MELPLSRYESFRTAKYFLYKKKKKKIKLENIIDSKDNRTYVVFNFEISHERKTWPKFFRGIKPFEHLTEQTDFKSMWTAANIFRRVTRNKGLSADTSR